MNRSKILNIAAIVFCLFMLSVSHLFPCSTFLLKHGKVILIGHNLDERNHIPGLVFINKRGVFKSAVSWSYLMSGKPDESPPFTWTSKYASITFNPLGQEFPDDGMNEAGLFIGEMTLAETKLSLDSEKPRIFMCLWMQYVLDTCETVAQVVASASALTIDGWAWHYFAADRTGETAVIEFLNGKLVVHTGETMPVPVLCNDVYERELKALKFSQEKTAEDPNFWKDKEIPRFVQATNMISAFPESPKPPVDCAFEILSALERGGTQWSFVCDPVHKKVFFKTVVSSGIKFLNLSNFDPNCDSPVKFVDIHIDGEGDVSSRFQDYTPESNKAFIREAVNAILKISPDLEKTIVSQGGTLDGLISRLATYPETVKCRKR